MALLKSDKREFRVPCRCLVGRSTLADLRVASARGSSEHATLGWYVGQWILRDLGSSNGTRVNERPLFPGDRTHVSVGDEIRFGDDDETWRVVDADDPDPCGVLLGPQRVQWGAQKLLVLPSSENPEASVFAESDGWHLDRGDELSSIACGDIVELPSGYWRLLVPEHTGHSRLRTAGPEFDLAEMSLSFSMTPEKLAVSLHRGGTTISLPSRACLNTLVALARLRMASRALEPERGWTSVMDLAGMLRHSPEKVNVDVHRLRKLLQDAGIRNAAQIIERDDAKRLRIGVSRITEEAPGSKLD